MDDEDQVDAIQQRGAACAVGCLSVTALLLISSFHEPLSFSSHPLFWTAAAAAGVFFFYLIYVSCKESNTLRCPCCTTLDVMTLCRDAVSWIGEKMVNVATDFKENWQSVTTCVAVLGWIVISIMLLIPGLHEDRTAQDVMWPILCVLTALLGPMTAVKCRTEHLEWDKAPRYVGVTSLMVCVVGLAAALCRELGGGYPTAYGDVHESIWQSTPPPTLKDLKDQWGSVKNRFEDEDGKNIVSETFNSATMDPKQRSGATATDDDDLVIEIIFREEKQILREEKKQSLCTITTFDLVDKNKQQRLTSISVCLCTALVAMAFTLFGQSNLPLWFAIFCGFFALNAAMCSMIALCESPVVLWGEYGQGCAPMCMLPFLLYVGVTSGCIGGCHETKDGRGIKQYFEQNREKPLMKGCVAVFVVLFVKVIHEFLMQVALTYADTPFLGWGRGIMHYFRPELQEACKSKKTEDLAACNLGDQNCYLCAALSTAWSMILMGLLFSRWPQKENTPPKKQPKTFREALTPECATIACLMVASTAHAVLHTVWLCNQKVVV